MIYRVLVEKIAETTEIPLVNSVFVIAVIIKVSVCVISHRLQPFGLIIPDIYHNLIHSLLLSAIPLVWTLTRHLILCFISILHFTGFTRYKKPNLHAR